MELKEQCHSMQRVHLFYTITSISQYLFVHKKFWEKLYDIVKRREVWGKEKLAFSVSDVINNSEGSLPSELYL